MLKPQSIKIDGKTNFNNHTDKMCKKAWQLSSVTPDMNLLKRNMLLNAFSCLHSLIAY